MGTGAKVGKSVIFVPKQACVTPESMERYAAIITQIHNDQVGQLVDLVTFGPQSLYFQKGVRFSDEPAHGCWSHL